VILGSIRFSGGRERQIPNAVKFITELLGVTALLEPENAIEMVADANRANVST
jgi:hypothetical protein